MDNFKAVYKILSTLEVERPSQNGVSFNRGGGHVIVAEKENGVVHFLDVQSGKKIDGSCLDKGNIVSVQYFRIDNLNISQHGTTSCEKGD